MTKLLNTLLLTAIIAFSYACSRDIETDAVKRLESTFLDKERYNQSFIEKTGILRNQLALCPDDCKKWEIAGGDPREKTANRSYKGKTVRTENSGDIDLIIETRKAIGKDKPLIVILPCSKPVIMKEFEEYADAILVSFGVQPQAYFDIISGAFEPSA